MSAKINLRNVTLCSVDCLHPMLAQRALLESARECDFADVVLLSDSPLPRDVRRIDIAPITSKHAYSTFMLKELHRHIRTPWVLIVQWDGYVINPRAWSETFFEYDYIGATWPKHTDGRSVGNGGFSLRSKRLLDVLATDEFPVIEEEPEDNVICRIHRAQLEARHGIRFAPPDVAIRFAYEEATPNAPTFGFHGAFNFWRHLDDKTLFRILDVLEPHTIRSVELLRLFWAYWNLRKFDCVRALYRRLREVFSHDEIAHYLKQFGAPDEVAAAGLDVTRILADRNTFA
jgi:hypothetical protein